MLTITVSIGQLIGTSKAEQQLLVARATTIMASGEESTFLESFVEHITNLPNEVLRNLDLVKDLDKSCSQIVGQLREAEEAYVQRAEQTILELPLATRKRKRDVSSSAVGKGGDNSDDDQDDDNVIVPTTEELRGRIMNPAELEMIARLRREAIQQSEEKVVVAEQTYSLVDEVVRRLDSDLSKFEALLKSSGAFEVAGGAKPNDLAAIQVNPNSTDWILATVISQDPDTGMYQLADEDAESNKVFNLPESQVVVLGGVDRLSRGDIIHAVYPDTTSFYQATVVQPPKKVGGGDSFVMVHFKDDGDEHGITHDKAVSMQHVMRVPYSSY